jgi:polyisoprenoid-binding protein YceI
MEAIRDMRAIRPLFLAIVLVVLAALPAAAEVIQFKLLPNYSRATFKTDAPLETIVGNAVAAALAGSLTLDPAKPREAKGVVTVDMSKVRTGIDKRDADMLDPRFLDATANEANKFVTFEVRGVEIAGPLKSGTELSAKISGIFTVRQKAVNLVADARVTYVKLTSEQVDVQKRFGFTPDNIKIRAKFATTFTGHGMEVPQLLIFKLSNEIELETDLTFARQ